MSPFRNLNILGFAKLPPEQRLPAFMMLCFIIMAFFMREDRKRHFEDDERAERRWMETVGHYQDENEFLRTRNQEITSDFIKFVIKSKTDIDTLEQKIETKLH